MQLTYGQMPSVSNNWNTDYEQSWCMF